MNDQFNISFTKNFGHNQICIKPTNIENTVTTDNTDNTDNTSNNNNFDNLYTYTNDYRIKMVCNNSINGLLNTNIQYLNNTPIFCYDINNLQSLSITLETKPLDYSLLSRIIYEIYNLLFACEKYMLDTDKLLLEPEYIFLSPNNSTINLCYLPLKTSDFITSLRKLFDYFLKNIDHSDEKCVYTAYSIHNHCVSNSITPSILVSYINTDDINLWNSQPSINNHNISQGLSHVATIPTSMSQPTTSLAAPPSTSTPYASTQSASTPYISTPQSYSPHPTLSSKNIPPHLITKFGLLAAGFLFGIIGLLSLIFFKLVDIPLFLILLLAHIILCLVIGYNLFSKMEGPIQALNITDSKCEDNTNSHIEDSGNTILLSSIENNDSHMLIYTGSDMNSQVNISHYPFSIGKESSCDFVISNPIISRLHCRINCYIDENNSTTYYAEDLNSTNGTFINNMPITPYNKTPIKSGDNISFGHLTYIFR